MNKSVKIAFSSIITALSVCLMFFTTFITTATYALPALSGIIIIAVIIEINSSYAFFSYFISSLLSLILVPDKTAVIIFITFFGYYPILKKHIEKFNNKLIKFGIKLSLFNFICIGLFFITKTFFLVSDEEFTIFGVYTPWLLLVIGNIVFIVYDYAVTCLTIMYINKLHPKIKKMMKF